MDLVAVCLMELLLGWYNIRVRYFGLLYCAVYSGVNVWQRIYICTLYCPQDIVKCYFLSLTSCNTSP